MESKTAWNRLSVRQKCWLQTSSRFFRYVFFITKIKSIENFYKQDSLIIEDDWEKHNLRLLHMIWNQMQSFPRFRNTGKEISWTSLSVGRQLCNRFLKPGTHNSQNVSKLDIECFDQRILKRVWRAWSTLNLRSDIFKCLN